MIAVNGPNITRAAWSRIERLECNTRLDTLAIARFGFNFRVVELWTADSHFNQHFIEV